MQPKHCGELFFPDNSRPLVLMNEIWWEDEYHLKDMNLSRGDIVVDIGANVGVFSWYALTIFPGIIVHALEPHPDNYEFLKKNIKPWNYRATTWNCAISYKEGYVQILEPQWLDGVRVVTEGNAMHKTPRNFKQHQGAKIPCSRLDVFFERAGIDKIALLKIDIEGAEICILEEFKSGLLSKIERVSMECHEHEYKGLAEEFIYIFQRSGFSVKKVVLCEDRSILFASKA